MTSTLTDQELRHIPSGENLLPAEETKLSCDISYAQDTSDDSQKVDTDQTDETTTPTSTANDNTFNYVLPFEAKSVWIRIFTASIIIGLMGGLSWGYTSIKSDLKNIGVFASRCPGGAYPCEDQELAMNLMYQIAVCVSQALSAISGIYFQVFKRRFYTFSQGALFIFGTVGFGLGLLVKDIPGLSDALFFTCYLAMAFAGISTLLGFLSYTRDVSAKGRGLAGALINAPFDTSSLVFFFFSLITNNLGFPLWIMFLVYGLVLGIAMILFSFIMEPKKKKAPPTVDPAAGTAAEKSIMAPIDLPAVAPSVIVTPVEAAMNQSDAGSSAGNLHISTASNCGASVGTLTPSTPQPHEENPLESDPVGTARPVTSRLDDFNVSTENYQHHHEEEAMEAPHAGPIPLALPDIDSLHLEATLPSNTPIPDSIAHVFGVSPEEHSMDKHSDVLSTMHPVRKGLSSHLSIAWFILSKMDLRKVIPFRLLFSPEVILFHIVQSLVVAQCNFQQATIFEQALWIGSGDNDVAVHLNTVFNIMLPSLGTIISLLVGPFLSHFHICIGISWILVAWVIWNVLALIQISWLQYGTFFFFICSRALYYIVMSVLVYTYFSASEATIIYSSIVTCSGIFAVVISYLSNYLAIKVFGGNFFVVNLVFGSCSTFFLILFVLAAFNLDRKTKRQQKHTHQLQLQEIALEASAQQPVKNSETEQQNVEQSSETSETDELKEPVKAQSEVADCAVPASCAEVSREEVQLVVTSDGGVEEVDEQAPPTDVVPVLHNTSEVLVAA